jgi:hypothetical protein
VGRNIKIVEVYITTYYYVFCLGKNHIQKFVKVLEKMLKITGRSFVDGNNTYFMSRKVQLNCTYF